MTSPYLNIIKKMRTAKELFAELNSFDENRRIEPSRHQLLARA